MADALVQVLACLFLRETYAPRILAVRKQQIQKATGKSSMRTEYDNPDRTLGQVLRKNFTRPFVMLSTEPAIQALALYRAYQYGLMYLVLASFPMVWEGVYKEGKGAASLNYISLGIGFIIGLQICGRAIDLVSIIVPRVDRPHLLTMDTGIQSPKTTLQPPRPPRIPPSPYNPRRPSRPNRSLPIRLVRRVQRSLDSPEHRRRHLRHRPDHLLPMLPDVHC